MDAIEPGMDFTEEIFRAVAACKVLLAIIGPDWLTAVDKRGDRRLDDPDDIVRLEIEAALARGVRVISILVEGAVMPGRQDLPESLAGFARRNALLIRHESFRLDAGRLVIAIERVLAAPSPAALGASDAYPRTDSARIELLKLQVSTALRITAAVSESEIERLLEVVQHEWVNQISVYGLDPSQKARCRLTIEIDWQRHRRHITAGRTEVSPGSRWINDLAVELDESIKLLKEYVRENSLTYWWTTHPDPDKGPISWKGPNQGVNFNIPELDELSVDLCLTD